MYNGGVPVLSNRKMNGLFHSEACWDFQISASFITRWRVRSSWVCNSRQKRWQTESSERLHFFLSMQPSVMWEGSPWSSLITKITDYSYLHLPGAFCTKFSKFFRSMVTLLPSICREKSWGSYNLSEIIWLTSIEVETKVHILYLFLSDLCSYCCLYIFLLSVKCAKLKFSGILIIES